MNKDKYSSSSLERKMTLAFESESHSLPTTVRFSFPQNRSARIIRCHCAPPNCPGHKTASPSRFSGVSLPRPLYHTFFFISATRLSLIVFPLFRGSSGGAESVGVRELGPFPGFMRSAVAIQFLRWDDWKEWESGKNVLKFRAVLNIPILFSAFRRPEAAASITMQNEKHEFCLPDGAANFGVSNWYSVVLSLFCFRRPAGPSNLGRSCRKTCS